jgi:tetratricopeptide (TPR) repeat protein
MGWFEDNIAACLLLSKCYNALKEEDKVLEVLLNAFAFDSPRSDICCEIGYYFKRLGNFNTAFKWFDLALRVANRSGSGFIMEDYLGYIPALEAAVCLSYLGRYDEANDFNEHAGLIKETDAVLHNREYFKDKVTPKEKLEE